MERKTEKRSVKEWLTWIAVLLVVSSLTWMSVLFKTRSLSANLQQTVPSEMQTKSSQNTFMSKKILCVIDMQNDFIDGALGTKEAQAIVENVVELIKGWDGPIYATRDTHQSDYLHTREGRILPVVHCIEGTEGWELRQEIEEELLKKQAVIINKPTFGSYDLMNELSELLIGDEYESLSEKDIDITFVGLCTDICVVSNTLLFKNLYPEAEVNVIENCCAGVTPESHQAALTTMKMCQVNIK